MLDSINSNFFCASIGVAHTPLLGPGPDVLRMKRKSSIP